MKNFNLIRFFITVVVLYVIDAFINYLLHGVLLADAYAQLDIWRDNMQEKMYIGYIVSAIYLLVFVFLYHHFVQGYYKSGLVAGVCYGFLVGILGIGMIWQYVLYPLPLSMMIKWYVSHLILQVVYGIITFYIYKLKKIEE